MRRRSQTRLLPYIRRGARIVKRGVSSLIDVNATIKDSRHRVTHVDAGTARSVLIAAVVVSLMGGCGRHGNHGTWALSNGNLAGTRSASGSAINSDNVGALRARWRFPFLAKPSSGGVFAATPIVERDTVYLQDLHSNVYALNRSTGAVLWAQRFRARTDEPNALAVDGGRVYGATDAAAFALSASNGRELWRVSLASGPPQLVDIAPV